MVGAVSHPTIVAWVRFQRGCHTCVEFLVGSCPASRVFLRILRFSTHHKNQHLQIPIQTEDKREKQLRLT